MKEPLGGLTYVLISRRPLIAIKIIILNFVFMKLFNLQS